MKFSELQKTVRVAKDKKNEFGGYRYRTAEGILAVIKAMAPPDCIVSLTDELREVAGQIFVEATATITIDGETHGAKAFAMHPVTKKGMDPSQITGAASSYARKTALAGLLALDDGSADPDAATTPYEPDVADPEETRDKIKKSIMDATSIDGLRKEWKGHLQEIKSLPEPMRLELTAAKDVRKDQLSNPGQNACDGDNMM